MDNPFNRRAAEQWEGDVIEHGALEYVDGEDYEERLNMLLARGKLVLQTEADKEAILTGKWRRAGNAKCIACGKEFIDHPMLHKYAILFKLCNGDLVKL